MNAVEKLQFAHDQMHEVRAIISDQDEGFTRLGLAMSYIRELIDDQAGPDAVTVKTIFEFWQKTMHSPKSKLDANRKGLIARALKIYSPADVCKAIRGCSKSPHHMGDNAQKTMYNGLNLILRNAEYIDKFIALDAGTARSATVETIEQQNSRVMAEIMGIPQNDNMTIEMQP